MDNFKLEKRNLSSGAKLINVKSPSFSYNIHSMWFKAGSRFDPENKEGLAHFFEHLLNARTKTYPVNSDRFKVLEKIGIDFSAFTTHEAAYYYHACLSRHNDESLRLLIEGVNEPFFSSEIIDQERNIVLDESLRNEQDPSQFIWRLSQKSLWPHKLLGRDFFGSKKTIASISDDDIVTFFDNYYRSVNATFVIVGNNNTDDLEELINEYYQKKSGETQLPLGDVQGDLKPVLALEKELDIVTIAINVRLLPMPLSKEKPVIDMLVNILASGWISLLINELRIKRNLTYWVNGSREYFTDTGYMRFIFSVHEKDLQEALSAVDDAFCYLMSKSLDVEDLKSHKQAYISWLIRNYSGDLHGLLYWVGWKSVVESEDWLLSEYLIKIQDIAVKDIRAVAEKYIRKDNISIVSIGPVKEDKIMDLYHKSVIC